MYSGLINLLRFADFNVGPCDPNKNGGSFFGLPHWWRYIKTGQYDGLGNCTPSVKFPQGIWAIGFAALDMLLYAAGIVAVVSIIIAGISYITAGGNAEQVSSARRRITNSLIGLAIVLIASATVSFIGNTVG